MANVAENTGLAAVDGIMRKARTLDTLEAYRNAAVSVLSITGKPRLVGRPDTRRDLAKIHEMNTSELGRQGVNTMEFISIAQVCELLTIGRTKLWELSKRSGFPKAVRITEGRKAFVRSEIDEWMTERVKERAMEDTPKQLEARLL